MEFQTLTYDIDGIKTVVKAIGSGPDLLALHGAATLEGHQIARGLAGRFRVLLPFHPGFGESGDAPHVAGMQDMVVHYLNLIDAMGLQQPHLMGHSMGGWMAAEIAVVAGDRFAKLVLNAPAGLNHPDHPATDLGALPPQDLPGYLAHHVDVALRYFPAGSDCPPLEQFLANRLSADPARRVLLPEAGGSDRYIWVHVPVGYLQCIGNPRTDWMYRIAEEPGLGGRSIAYLRGKVTGGCSSINGMIYMRGQAADYDGWAQIGCTGWDWATVLPQFCRSEAYHRSADGHGTTGELRVERQRLHWPILDALREATAEIGSPPTEDFNQGSNEGAGYFEVNQKAGARWSAARAFLGPEVKRPATLSIVTSAHVTRLRIENARVIGVEFECDGQPAFAAAESDVLLAAGAIGTPQILMLSGLGPGAHLREMGTALQRVLPGVGANLQDHLQIRTEFRISGARTLNDMQASLWGKARIAADYALRRRGPMAMAPSQLGLFTRSDPHLATPDLEFHIQPLSLKAFGQPLNTYPAITVSVCNLRPESRGEVRLAAPDARRAPIIAPRYLSTPGDRRVAVAAIRAARRLMATRRMAAFAPQEVTPGAVVTDEADMIEAAGRIATTIFHPVGTARMGRKDDPMAVVDPHLQLCGIENLMIADASVMPTIVSGNTHAPVVMIAERAAIHVLSH